MNEEKLISTLKECVDYLAKKYGMKPELDYANDNGCIYYKFGNHYKLSGDFSEWCLLERHEKIKGNRMYFNLSKTINDEEKNLVIQFDKDLNITRAGFRNCEEDFDYVYNKIKEVMR